MRGIALLLCLMGVLGAGAAALWPADPMADYWRTLARATHLAWDTNGDQRVTFGEFLQVEVRRPVGLRYTLIGVMDRNRNGRISRREFARRCEQEPAYQRFDIDGDGRLRLGELPPASAESLPERFRLLDRNGDGAVDLPETRFRFRLAAEIAG